MAFDDIFGGASQPLTGCEDFLTWSPTCSYNQDRFVSYNGDLYYSLQSGNIGHSPADSPEWWQVFDSNKSITTCNLLPWQGGCTYNFGDLVSLDGHIFVSLANNNTGNQPSVSDRTYWSVYEINDIMAWKTSFLYPVGSSVFHNNQIYYAQTENKGKEPGLSSDWKLADIPLVNENATYSFRDVIFDPESLMFLQSTANNNPPEFTNGKWLRVDPLTYTGYNNHVYRLGDIVHHHGEIFSALEDAPIGIPVENLSGWENLKRYSISHYQPDIGYEIGDMCIAHDRIYIALKYNYNVAPGNTGPGTPDNGNWKQINNLEYSPDSIYTDYDIVYNPDDYRFYRLTTHNNEQIKGYSPQPPRGRQNIGDSWEIVQPGERYKYILWEPLISEQHFQFFRETKLVSGTSTLQFADPLRVGTQITLGHHIWSINYMNDRNFYIPNVNEYPYNSLTLTDPNDSSSPLMFERTRGYYWYWGHQYRVGDIVEYKDNSNPGCFYICIKNIDSSEQPPKWDNEHFIEYTQFCLENGNTVFPVSRDFEWNGTVNYMKNNFVSYHGKLYVSLSDSNLGNVPDSTSEWEEYLNLTSVVSQVNQNTQGISDLQEEIDNLPITDAITKSGSGEINSITLKSNPVNNDVVLIEDSADNYNKKKISVSSLISTGSVTYSKNSVGFKSGYYPGVTMSEIDSDGNFIIDLFPQSNLGKFIAYFSGVEYTFTERITREFNISDFDNVSSGFLYLNSSNNIGFSASSYIDSSKCIFALFSCWELVDNHQFYIEPFLVSVKDFAEIDLYYKNGSYGFGGLFPTFYDNYTKFNPISYFHSYLGRLVISQEVDIDIFSFLCFEDDIYLKLYALGAGYLSYINANGDTVFYNPKGQDSNYSLEPIPENSYVLMFKGVFVSDEFTLLIGQNAYGTIDEALLNAYDEFLNIISLIPQNQGNLLLSIYVINHLGQIQKLSFDTYEIIINMSFSPGVNTIPAREKIRLYLDPATDYSYMSLVPGATSGNLAVFDSNGQVIDGGEVPSGGGGLDFREDLTIGYGEYTLPSNYSIGDKIRYKFVVDNVNGNLCVISPDSNSKIEYAPFANIDNGYGYKAASSSIGSSISFEYRGDNKWIVIDYSGDFVFEPIVFYLPMGGHSSLLPLDSTYDVLIAFDLVTGVGVKSFGDVFAVKESFFPAGQEFPLVGNAYSFKFAGGYLETDYSDIDNYNFLKDLTSNSTFCCQINFTTLNSTWRNIMVYGFDSGNFIQFGVTNSNTLFFKVWVNNSSVFELISNEVLETDKNYKIIVRKVADKVALYCDYNKVALGTLTQPFSPSSPCKYHIGADMSGQYVIDANMGEFLLAECDFDNSNDIENDDSLVLHHMGYRCNNWVRLD